MDLFTLENTLDNATFALLFLTMLLYWGSVAFPAVTLLWTLGTTGMGLASLCTTGLLLARWIEAGYFPISNLYESLFFLAWGITVVHLIAENMSRNRLVGAFTAPIAMGITAFAALTLPDTMQKSEPLVPALKSNWLMMHVSVMMLSYATLLVGSLLAIAFLVVTRGQAIALRGSSVGTGSFRTGGSAQGTIGLGANPEPEALATSPAMASTAMASGVAASSVAASTATVVLTRTTLDTPAAASVAAPTLSPQRLTLADTLDNISYRIIGLGFPLLTIGIIAGAVWANEAWGTYWSWDPKETWALITWLVFAAYLHARITKGWQGRRPAILAATGFAVVWVCYLGVNILGKGLHSYGWFF
jgi:cytochrome c-type biogenesis protein CcsB